MSHDEARPNPDRIRQLAQHVDDLPPISEQQALDAVRILSQRPRGAGADGQTETPPAPGVVTA